MRHEVTLTMRPAPRWLRWWRSVRHPAGSWPLATSWPWWWHWFAAVVPYRFRRLHHWYATTGAWFWIPCPLCGREFGGHEWRQVHGKPASIPTGENSAKGICPRCTRDGRGIA